MDEKIDNWWEQAKEDLDSAEQNLKINKFYLVAFLSQQAIEKGLKALLLKKRISPGTIHSLTKLGGMAKIPSEFKRFLRSISPDYYISRYPDASEETPFKLYTKDDVKDILNQTKEVFKWLEIQIKK